MRELFKGKRVVLAAPQPEDSEASLEWHADSAFLRMVDTDIAFPRSAEAIAAFQTPGPNTFPFTIRLPKNDEPIGFVALHSIEWNNRCGMLSIGIGAKGQQGKGYGTEALSLALGFAFCELNLHRVGLSVIEGNPAIGLYTAAGFVPEGRARQFVFRDGEYHDLIYMGLLQPEWVAP